MGKRSSRRVILDALATALSALAAGFTVSALVDVWKGHQEDLKRVLEPAQNDLAMINQALKGEDHHRFLTNQTLKSYAERYSTSLFNAAIQNPKVAEKSPEEQDTLHRIQLLELKSDRLETQVMSLSTATEKPWWKEPSTFYLVALFFVFEKIFSRVVEDLVAIGWLWIARKLGIRLPQSSGDDG